MKPLLRLTTRPVAPLRIVGRLAVMALLVAHAARLPGQQLALVREAALPNAPVPQTTESQALPTQRGSITGSVMDASGAVVPGAHVVLTPEPPAHGLPREVISNSDGDYSFADVAAGTYRLTVAADGFAGRTVTSTLTPGQVLESVDFTLAVASSSSVEVTASRVEIAQAEISLEEHQRVLGVIPNFYVSYVPNPEPLTTKQKYILAVRTFADPTAFVGAGISAGVLQADGFFKGYGNGLEGYSKRYAAQFGDGMFGTLLGGAVFPSLLHQDPRYFYKGTGSTGSRIWYAIASSVRCKGDNGHWQVDASGIGGGLAAAGVSNLYYPKADRNGWNLTLENTGFGILGSAVGNIFQEFLVKKLTPHVPDYSPGQ